MFVIRYRRGDLLVADATVIAHGCNVIGRMGAGIAAQIRRAYPEMFEDYVKRCRRREFSVGTAYLFRLADGRGVINIGTQGRDGAELWAIDLGFRALRDLCERSAIGTVAMPKIGTGLGGLSWTDVEPLLVRAFEGSEIVVDVYVLPDEDSRTMKVPARTDDRPTSVRAGRRAGGRHEE